MLPNAFIGKTKQPTAAELKAQLGPAKAVWDQLLAELAKDGIDLLEWNSYSPKAGWALRLKHLKRNILYLSPSRGCFMVSFALGDKAVQVARGSALPAHVIKVINEARRYAEGTAVRIDVHAAGDIAIIRELARIKLEN